MNYSDKLKSPKWQKKRLEILQRDKWTCKKCGDKETTLHIHHKEYVKGLEPWEHDNKLLVTLCEHCHTEVERCKKAWELKDITIFKMNNWQGGSRIMLINMPGQLTMRIYDDKGEFLIGYNFNEIEDLIAIKKSVIKIIKEI